MADSSDQYGTSPRSTPFQDEQTSPTNQFSRVSSLEFIPSPTPSPTRFEFIVNTGEESDTVAKENLKTVRSHVMKNYLSKQERPPKGTGESSNPEKRKGKQRARSPRSISQEAESSLDTESAPKGLPATTEMGYLFSGFSLSSPLIVGQPENAQDRKQPFALDFGYYATTDEASMYAQSYIVSLIQDKIVGLIKPSWDTLHSKGETVRTVKDTLSVFGNEMPQSTVFAVTTLAFGCVVDSEWDEARGHMEALQRLISTCGGLEAVDFELRRTFTWTSYTLSTVLTLPPPFPPPLFPTPTPFTLPLLDSAHLSAWRTQKRFPKNQPFVFDLVVRLHQISIATSTEWCDRVDQRNVSNLYFEALDSIIKAAYEEPWKETVPNGNAGREASTMFKVWVVGLPVFVWGTVRHMRTRLGLTITRWNYEPLYTRVREILEGTGGYHAWPRGKSLEPVLATLFYCIESCEIDSPWRVWFRETMRKVVEMLKVKSVEEFRKTLEFFPSTREYREVVDEVWREIS